MFCPVDHNVGRTVVYCPRAYELAVSQLFSVEGSPHYFEVADSASVLMDRFHAFGRSMGHVLPFAPDAKACLPYAYGLPKQKDLSKMRPIVSFSQHPAYKGNYNPVWEAALSAVFL